MQLTFLELPPVPKGPTARTSFSGGKAAGCMWDGDGLLQNAENRRAPQSPVAGRWPRQLFPVPHQPSQDGTEDWAWRYLPLRLGMRRAGLFTQGPGLPPQLL